MISGLDVQLSFSGLLVCVARKRIEKRCKSNGHVDMSGTSNHKEIMENRQAPELSPAKTF